MLVVVNLSREGASTDDFYLSALVDEDVVGVDVTDLALEVLELVARPHHVVEQIPQLGLQKVLAQVEPVLDFGLQHELVVLVLELR